MFGFAFENYDAISRWRTTERVTDGQRDDPPVQARGSFLNGRSEEIKQLLTGELDRFAEAFVGQLATYALRRLMTINEADQIKAIAAAS